MTSVKGKNVGSEEASSDRQVGQDNKHVCDEETPGIESSDANGEDQGASDALLEEADPESEEDFNPLKCLFCNQIQPTLDENLAHMLKNHGLFIPEKEYLVVDVEILTGYLHLIIFAYLQCFFCGTERSSAEAVQQHMMGKSHCKFDISSKDSEFRVFYDFDPSFEGDDAEQHEGARIPAKLSTVPIVHPDETSLWLPSGKILSHRSARQPRSQHHKPSHSTENTDPQLVSDQPISASSNSTSVSNHSSASAFLRAERKNVIFNNQLVQLRANDRSLMHMPISHSDVSSVLAVKYCSIFPDFYHCMILGST